MVMMIYKSTGKNTGYILLQVSTARGRLKIIY
jgi:hypothetical protein